MKQGIWILSLVLAGWQADPALAQQHPRLDVAFLIDATGSMGDEIDAVKGKIREMIADIASGEPAPDVRFGVVAYRDRGDEYITRVYPLSREIDQIVANLDQVQADGGGDYPESFNEALHQALHGLDWDTAEGVSRLVFLIADAPPHLDYPDDYDYRQEIQTARQMGIAIHAIGASGLDQDGESIFREVAAGTGGRFQWLTYESQYVDQDGAEVRVVVEGRTATYTKGDSTWTVAGEAVPMVGLAERGDVKAEMAGAPAGAGTGDAVPAPATTNLDELITGAIEEAAEAQGAAYRGGEETAVRASSWGQVKAQGR